MAPGAAGGDKEEKTKSNYELQVSRTTHFRSQTEIWFLSFSVEGMNSCVPHTVIEHTAHRDRDLPCQNLSEDDQKDVGSVLLTCHPSEMIQQPEPFFFFTSLIYWLRTRKAMMHNHNIGTQQ